MIVCVSTGNCVYMCVCIMCSLLVWNMNFALNLHLLSTFFMIFILISLFYFPEESKISVGKFFVNPLLSILLKLLVSHCFNLSCLLIYIPSIGSLFSWKSMLLSSKNRYIDFSHIKPLHINLPIFQHSYSFLFHFNIICHYQHWPFYFPEACTV